MYANSFFLLDFDFEWKTEESNPTKIIEVEMRFMIT